ncbi:venom allergen-like protein vap-2, partial [Aphelenchoides avenae]
MAFVLFVVCALVVGALSLTDTERSAARDSHNNYRTTLANGEAVNNDGTTLPQGGNIFSLVSRVALGSAFQSRMLSNTTRASRTSRRTGRTAACLSTHPSNSATERARTSTLRVTRRSTQ